MKCCYLGEKFLFPPKLTIFTYSLQPLPHSQFLYRVSQPRIVLRMDVCAQRGFFEHYLPIPFSSA